KMASMKTRQAPMTTAVSTRVAAGRRRHGRKRERIGKLLLRTGCGWVSRRSCRNDQKPGGGLTTSGYTASGYERQLASALSVLLGLVTRFRVIQRTSLKGMVTRTRSRSSLVAAVTSVPGRSRSSTKTTVSLVLV